MPFVAPKPNNTDFTPPPAGTHAALCYRLVDIGTQLNTYQQPPKPQHKIIVSWELPDEKMADGQPFTVHQRYTFSLHKKAALRADLEAWRGRPFTDEELDAFDLENLLGKPCMLSVIHKESNGRIYANVSSVSKLPKGLATPDRPANPIVSFSLSNPDWRVFDELSEGLRETIKKSPEYTAHKQPVADAPNERRGGELDDDIPFGPEWRV